MAATAYASLVSLLNTLDLIHTHPRLTTTLDQFQNESLRQIVHFFVDFLEKYSDAETSEAEDLVRQIADVAREAEDLIEVHAADRIRAGSTAKGLTVLLSLQRIIEEMNLIKEEVSKLKEEEGTGFITQSSISTHPSSSSAAAAPPATANTTTMVGFDGYVEQLLDQLIGLQSCRRIIPIVGMGGIGKTTLARNLYENSRILHYFDVRAWVTVSQEYNPRDILLQAVSCLNKSIDKMDGRTDDQLGEELHKILYARRYLIVLDDVWSVEAWDKIKFYLPENKNGSRIVVTTRQQELVDYFGSSALAVDFLDDKNSWELFCENTFAQKGCPHPELEQVGKRIVKKCKGLPLAIVVIGGLLGKSSRTPEYWEKIAEDINLILKSGEGNKVMSILYLSYKHLPVCLKPCFLHLGLFPEDCEIDLDQLIQLWVAEGFIKPKRDQSLEEVAEGYIKNLIDRNLLLRIGDGRVQYLLRESSMRIGDGRVHDLVRESCIRIGEKENFYCVQRGIDGSRHFTMAMRFYYSEYFCVPSIVHTRILEGQRVATPSKSRLLRVLFSESDDDYHIQLDSNFREVNLRFLFHHWPMSDFLPSSISRLWCLQTLILPSSCRFFVPVEIWKMPQLRHIDMRPTFHLPNPPPSSEQEDVIVLHNLQTLKTVLNLIFTEEVCKRIPNIKELEIYYDTVTEEEGGASSCYDTDTEEEGGASSCYDLHNVSCFNKLVSLSYWSDCPHIICELANVKLPSSLKELCLGGSDLDWSYMAMIASLPHLQILKLDRQAFVGAEWNMSAEEEFLCLKHLKISSCDDLIYWSANSSNFPVLETLELKWLSKLKEIPSGIGEISTLERIEMYNCSESATVSAVGIVEEQQSLGNYDLRLHLYFTHHSESQMLTEKIKQLDSTCHKLHIRETSDHKYAHVYSYSKETYY